MPKWHYRARAPLGRFAPPICGARHVAALLSPQLASLDRVVIATNGHVALAAGEVA